MHKLSFAAAGRLLALAGCAAPPPKKEDVAAQMRDPKAIAFYAASPAGKAEMMRAHYRCFAARATLTEAQRAACLGMLARAGGEEKNGIFRAKRAKYAKTGSRQLRV